MNVVSSARTLVVVLLLLLFEGMHDAAAHPLQLAAPKTEMSATDNEVLFTTRLAYILPFPSEEQKTRIEFATAYYGNHLLLKQAGYPCAGHVSEVDQSDMTQTVFRGAYVCPKSIQEAPDLSITSTLWFDVFDKVNHFFVLEAATRHEAMLSKESPQVFFSNDSSKKLTVTKDFVAIGIEHILFGWDHVLFVLAMHLIVRRFKDILILVTSFTISHSLTLILGASGVLTLSSSIVEPLIAFSIAYTAFRNLEIECYNQQSVLRERWIGAFGFGLIHGLGFAGALSEIRIPPEHFFSALLGFNVGVELGQLLIVSIFVPLLLLFSRFIRISYVVYLISGLILAISVFWTLTRIFIVQTAPC